VTVIDDGCWSAIVEAARPYRPDKRARRALEEVLAAYPGLLRNAKAIRLERERMRRIVEGIDALIPGLEALHRDLTDTATEINLYDLDAWPH
jgi:hypothetical protein